MNAKILSPREVIEAVERKWREAPEHASIEQVEGFIRQILGWREYMRGIYWAKMPEYAAAKVLKILEGVKSVQKILGKGEDWKTTECGGFFGLCRPLAPEELHCDVKSED